MVRNILGKLGLWIGGFLLMVFLLASFAIQISKYGYGPLTILSVLIVLLSAGLFVGLWGKGPLRVGRPDKNRGGLLFGIGTMGIVGLAVSSADSHFSATLFASLAMLTLTLVLQGVWHIVNSRSTSQ